MGIFEVQGMLHPLRRSYLSLPWYMAFLHASLKEVTGPTIGRWEHLRMIYGLLMSWTRRRPREAEFCRYGPHLLQLSPPAKVHELQMALFSMETSPRGSSPGSAMGQEPTSPISPYTTKQAKNDHRIWIMSIPQPSSPPRVRYRQHCYCSPQKHGRARHRHRDQCADSISCF